MNETLNMVANLLNTMICNVRIVKHKAQEEREDDTYTVELINDNGKDWYIVGRMNRGGSITFYAPSDYVKVDYSILAMYRCNGR